MTEIQSGMLKELLEVDTGLTEWEIGFITKLKSGWKLSVPQEKKLKQIWEKIFND